MSKPQQPELRRSERVPALSPDAMEAELEATPEIDVDPPPPNGPDTDGPVADGTAPVQDKPDLDEMAEALGVEAPEDERSS